jgi:hypothetical protein
VDSKEVVEFMSATFGAERQSLHRLIHEHLQDEETSIKSLAVPFEPEIGNDDVTRVGDLSPLVDLTRSESDAGLGPRLRPRRTKWIAAAVGALVVLGGVWMGWSTRQPEDKRRAPALADAPLKEAALVLPELAKPSPEPIAPSANTGPVVRPVSAAEIEDSETETQEAEDREPPETESLANEARPIKKRRARRAAREPNGSVASSPGSDLDETSQVVAPPPPNRPAPSIGEDLSKPPQQRRQLDENPFR